MLVITGDEPPLLLGVSVDPSATAANAAANPRQLTVLTRALFPPRMIVFDVETTGFAQDDVIVEVRFESHFPSFPLQFSLTPSLSPNILPLSVLTFL